MDSNQISRRGALAWGGGAFVAGMTAMAPSAWAQSAYPSKPITIIVGYPPGGQTDFGGRMITAGLQSALGQSVVIDNRAGVGGNIGADYVMKAPPDGYRLLAGNGAMCINPHTYRNTAMVDPLKFTPIGLMLESALVLVVPANMPVHTFGEYVSWIKAQEKTRGGVDYASSAAGSLTHVTMELMRDRIGKPTMTHVAYKGSGPAIIDVIAGRVSGLFDAASVVSPFVKSGQLRPLMVTSAKRVPSLPDVPTATELGLKDFEILAFIGLYGPPGLPAPIVERLNTALNASLKDPALVRTIADRGENPGGGTPEHLKKMTTDDFNRWRDIVKENDIRAE
ncbi:tripartite tricarboxylate transporter substrate binding protein [Xylophilus rhododendri]|uniref:Tripartite tricarboxylate transporter substrate binding protein n=1 Tax=Xylophilus rhododendri TaxID=2697032 RepID=A0A857J4L8_9BURK|nr:tripartite tricarboxylate transporter substrate binding protein [Xylophilus rhododendri]QHI97795.1 tripartite tricarboxylate transporter substrate binding protein [Xylophilus rhododendri]